jgi:transcription-repair coupling factor (superfamily II helicase)
VKKFPYWNSYREYSDLVRRREFIKEKIQQQEEDLEVFLELIQTPGHQLPVHDDDGEINEKKDVSENDFVKAVIFRNGGKRKTHYKSLERKPLSLPTANESTINFSTKEQPAFNRQFDLLIKT